MDLLRDEEIRIFLYKLNDTSVTLRKCNPGIFILKFKQIFYPEILIVARMTY